jgi:hypothetical protein
VGGSSPQARGCACAAYQQQQATSAAKPQETKPQDMKDLGVVRERDWSK